MQKRSGFDNTTAELNGTYAPFSETARALAAEALLVPISKAGREQILTQNNVAMRTWYAALANRDNAKAVAVLIGDSMTEGEGATTLGQRWATRAQDLLRHKFPVLASSLAGGVGFLPPYYKTTTLPAPATLAGAGTVQTASFGPGGRCLYMPQAGDTITWNVFGTSVDVLYAKGSATGVFSWSVDGAAATNVNTVDAPSGSGVDGFTTRITFASRGWHSVTIAWVSTNPVYIDGLYVFDGNESAGIHLVESAHTGWKASNQNAALSHNSINTIANWGIGPSLVVIRLGVNEWVQSVASATFQTELNTLVGLAKAMATVQPSILICANYQDLGTYAEAWSAFVNVMYATAAADTGIAIYDETLRMPPVTGYPLGLYTGDGHPLPKGHALMADYFVQAVSPS